METLWSKLGAASEWVGVAEIGAGRRYTRVKIKVEILDCENCHIGGMC